MYWKSYMSNIVRDCLIHTTALDICKRLFGPHINTINIFLTVDVFNTNLELNKIGKAFARSHQKGKYSVSMHLYLQIHLISVQLFWLTQMIWYSFLIEKTHLNFNFIYTFMNFIHCMFVQFALYIDYIYKYFFLIEM